MAAIRCTDTAGLRVAIRRSIAYADGKYGSGIGAEPIRSLHARSDRDDVRDHVCNELAQLPIKALAIAVDKTKLDPARSWRTDREAFYNEVAAYLLVNSLHLHQRTRIILSHKNYDGQVDLEAMTKAIAKRWTLMLATSKKPMTSVTAAYVKAPVEPCLQAVDYVAWAVFRAFERGDLSWYNKLQPAISWVWAMPRLAHYTRRRPMKNPP